VDGVLLLKRVYLEPKQVLILEFVLVQIGNINRVLLVLIFVIAKVVFLEILIAFGVKKVTTEWVLAKILDLLDAHMLHHVLVTSMEVVLNV